VRTTLTAGLSNDSPGSHTNVRSIRFSALETETVPRTVISR